MKENLNKRDDVRAIYRQLAALSILEMFGQENTLSLSVIANLAGSGKNNCLSVGAYFDSRDFDAGSSYEIVLFGGTGASAGLCTVQRQDVKRIAHDFLWNFHERTKISTYLAIPWESEFVCGSCGFRQYWTLEFSICGGVYPLFRGASNRVLLAFASPQFQSNYLNSLELEEDEKTQLKEDLKGARTRGYDITHNRLTEGLFAVGFPIYNSANQLVAGLSVGGVDDLERPDAVEQCIQQGHQLAVEINNQMGSNYYSRIYD